VANPWTSFYWDSYERKTADLSVTEHGAYFLLIKHYYCNGGPIQANASRLLTVCRAFADAERAAVMSVLDRFFVLEGDVYRHERCDEELAEAAQLSEKRSIAGKSGAEKKRQKRQQKPPANATANAKQLLTQLQLQKKGFVLPVWISEKTWNEYETMRKRIRKPMTDRARELAVMDLEALMRDGEDVEAVLNTSIKNSWQGLFAVKGEKNSNAKPSVLEQIRRARENVV
jgi:uncharacterized protein YdaU (DUF1376 family)